VHAACHAASHVGVVHLGGNTLPRVVVVSTVHVAVLVAPRVAAVEPFRLAAPLLLGDHQDQDHGVVHQVPWALAACLPGGQVPCSVGACLAVGCQTGSGSGGSTRTTEGWHGRAQTTPRKNVSCGDGSQCSSHHIHPYLRILNRLGIFRLNLSSGLTSSKVSWVRRNTHAHWNLRCDVSHVTMPAAHLF